MLFLVHVMSCHVILMFNFIIAHTYYLSTNAFHFLDLFPFLPVFQSNITKIQRKKKNKINKPSKFSFCQLFDHKYVRVCYFVNIQFFPFIFELSFLLHHFAHFVLVIGPCFWFSSFIWFLLNSNFNGVFNIILKYAPKLKHMPKN